MGLADEIIAGATTAIYAALTWLTLRTAWRYRAMLGELLRDRASLELAVGIVLVSVGVGLEQVYWTLAPLQDMAGIDYLWMRGTKHYMLPFALLAIWGYCKHLERSHATEGHPGRWRVELAVSMGVGLGLVALAIGWRVWA